MKKKQDFDIGWRAYVVKLILAGCLFLFFLPSAGWAQQKDVRVTLKMSNADLVSVFKAITARTGYDFVYSSSLLDKSGKISLNVKNELLSDVVGYILKGTNLGYKFDDKHIIISQKMQQPGVGASVTYSGTVKSKAGDLLPGATVVLKGTSSGVAANELGKFTIVVPETIEPVLVFSFMGMKQKEVRMKSTAPVTIALEENIEEIEEAVITGIFNKPKESFTGAVVKVTREELKMAGNRNILRSLSNIDPSFVIVENNSQGSNPNALPEIRLRGVSSIPSVDALHSTTRAELTTPLFILDGFEISLERVMDLNNDEIESITVLKDASATAIYGSRGSNGVVVITSVKPEQGKLKFTYNGNVNMEIPDLDSYDLLNAREKLQLEWDAGLYDYADNPLQDVQLKRIYAQKLERVMAGVNTDWLSIPVRTGVGHSHNLGFGGGDEAFRYNVNLSFNKTRGAMKGSDRQTLNGTTSVSYLGKKFSLSNSMSFGINKSENSPYGSFGTYAILNPYWEPYGKDGYLVKQFETEKNALFGRPVTNPLWDANVNSFDRSRYTSINNNFSAVYKPADGLQIVARVSFNKTFSGSDNFVSPRASQYFNSVDVSTNGERTYSDASSSGWSAGLTGNYAKSWGKHVVSAGVNWEIRENNDKSHSFIVVGFVNDKMNSMGMAMQYRGDRKATSSDTKSRAVGFTGTANYSYDNRYYVDASYRLDGASSFGSDSRFAPFWSLGCGWTISNEPLVKEHLGFISNMRVKYSYGVTGSMSFSPWQSQGTYRYGSQYGGTYMYHGMISAVISGLENKDLKWQNTYQQNVGFDLGFLANRISLSANYYRKLTDNSITDMALPLSNGFTSYTGNSGEILNTGFDLSLSFYLLRNPEKQLSWSVVLGTSHNKNKLRTLSQAVKERMKEMRADQSSKLFYVYEEGQSVDAIYAVPTVGVDPSTGNMVYRYLDGTESYKYDVNQRIPCGDRMPKFDGRISTSVNWKGLSINAGFTLRLGGQKYNDTYAGKIENVDLSYNVDRRVMTERWRNPGDEAAFSGLKTRNSYIVDRYVQDENTFSCNNVNVTYDFRGKWVKGAGLDRLSLTASVGNVFYLSTVRQERGTGYPFAIQPTLGLSCAF